MTYRPTIRTQRDLETVWRTLMGPLGFSSQSLWLLLIGQDDAPIPMLPRIEDLKQPPDAEETERLAGFLQTIVEAAGVPDARVAVLRSRPGRHGPDAADRRWADAVYAAARIAGVRCEPVHLATDADVLPLPRDDEGVVASA